MIKNKSSTTLQCISNILLNLPCHSNILLSKVLLQVHKSILESFWPNTFCRKLLYQHKVISYKEHMNAEIKIRIQCFLGGKVAKNNSDWFLLSRIYKRLVLHSKLHPYRWDLRKILRINKIVQRSWYANSHFHQI